MLSFLATFVRHCRHPFKMRHPKDVGDLTTMMVMVALREAGFDVYLPFGESTRSDLITRSSAALRVTPTKNQQSKNVRWAAVYELTKIDPY